MPLDLKTALCGPYSDVKSWQPWSFTAVPDCPQTQAPNIIQIQRKGTQINLIRDTPFPEPRFICLSKGPVNEPPPVSSRGHPHGQSCPFPAPSYIRLTNSSIKGLPIRKKFTLLSKALGKERHPMFPKTGPLWK